MEEIKEYIDNRFLELRNYVENCFEEQSKNNNIFFDNILELVKVSISKENQANSKQMLDLIENLKDTTNINDVLCKKMITELKNIDSIYGMLKDEEPNNKKILYTDILKGVKQFALQLIITVTILLIILGAFQLISLIF
ncbi:hypothetical protein [[Clostridium] colinum]|uniref:hypothetical protein n=1 Tax=[Clostridium] colinum TaxID=36835 RepID=UPI0020255D55|nr:hypothetical protein [[Clostridium] colinum]